MLQSLRLLYGLLWRIRAWTMIVHIKCGKIAKVMVLLMMIVFIILILINTHIWLHHPMGLVTTSVRSRACGARAGEWPKDFYVRP